MGKYYTIYLVKSPTNKYYVGITSRTLEARKYHHYYYHEDRKYLKFSKALKKYDQELEWKVLEKTTSWSKAKRLEIKYIEKYNSYKLGYNSTLGGEGRLKHTNEDLIKDARKYKTRSEWRSNSKSKYEAARLRNKELFNECCEHMVKKIKMDKRSIDRRCKKI